MEKKYELLGPRKEGLYRIRALKDFGFVKKGDIGGFVESKNNLSQEGTCWVYNDAVVKDNSIIAECAEIRGESVIRNSTVSGYSTVTNTTLYESCIEGYVNIHTQFLILSLVHIRGYVDIETIRDILQINQLYAGPVSIYNDLHKGLIFDSLLLDDSMGEYGFVSLLEQNHDNEYISKVLEFVHLMMDKRIKEKKERNMHTQSMAQRLFQQFQQRNGVYIHNDQV